MPEVAHGGPPGLVVGPVMKTVARKHAFELNLMGKRTWDAAKAERLAKYAAQVALALDGDRT